MLGDTARCLRGDIFWARHGILDRQRCWVCSREAAAHALIDWTIPREKSVFSQRALPTTHRRKMIQRLQPESKNIDCVHHALQCQYSLEIKGKLQCDDLQQEMLMLIYISAVLTYNGNFILNKSYCLIRQSRGKNQLRKEDKKTEEAVQLISHSPSWFLQLPNRGIKSDQKFS